VATSHAPINRQRALALGGAVAGGILSAGAGALAPLIAGATAQFGEQLVLAGVTIVNTHDGSLQHGMAVYVNHGKISKIAPAASVGVDRSATVIDARGKYLVPGYNDLHAHPLSSSDPEGSLTLLLANGVTGFREMASGSMTNEQRRAGTLLPIGAPELLQLASETLSPANVRTPEAAAAYVQNQLKRGADFIKIIEYTPAIFSAVAAECKRQNVRFMGHLSPAVDVRAAATAGMASIEHMGPRDSILLGCSTNEAALRPGVPAPPATGAAASPAGPPPPELIARGLVNPTLTTTPARSCMRVSL
jgi:hypothetical protein